MGNYTLELTYDELKIISKTLTREYDRLDDLGSPLLKDVEPLEDRVHEMYINARKSVEHEMSWIVAN